MPGDGQRGEWQGLGRDLNLDREEYMVPISEKLFLKVHWCLCNKENHQCEVSVPLTLHLQDFIAVIHHALGDSCRP